MAVDHWDTDNPHTHVVLRGKDQAGENLVIGREYISRGMRVRACELATSWLGPRSEREIQASLQRDVHQQRFTGLDRTLTKLTDASGVVDLRVPDDVGGLRDRGLLTGRVQHLQTLGLAQPVDPGRWQLRADFETVLLDLGERNDIVRTMQRTFGKERRELAFAAFPDGVPITGRIAAKGMGGEVHDKPYLLVDGLDGRAHHVSLPGTVDLAELPVGGIVEVRPARDSIADRNIAAIAKDGWYVRKRHINELRGHGCESDRAEEIVEGHVRRLEALRRAGIVQRVADGIWEVPKDLVDRGRAYDRKRLAGIELEVQSHLPIEKQIRAIGATWLDRQLVNSAPPAPTSGFAAATSQAVSQRLDFLVEQGLAERRDGRAHVSPSLLATLRDREIVNAAASIHRQTGLVHRPIKDGVQLSGVYRSSVQLISGRFAMLSDGLGFALVPWQPVIEKSLGRTISAVVRGDRVAWQLGRQRGLSR